MPENATIFVADDDASVRDPLRSVIESNGWKVESPPFRRGASEPVHTEPARLPDSRSAHARNERAGTAQGTTVFNACHLHQRT
jgi:hypothetical protein